MPNVRIFVFEGPDALLGNQRFDGIEYSLRRIRVVVRFDMWVVLSQPSLQERRQQEEGARNELESRHEKNYATEWSWNNRSSKFELRLRNLDGHHIAYEAADQPGRCTRAGTWRHEIPTFPDASPWKQRDDMINGREIEV